MRRRRVLLARNILPTGTDDSMTTPPGASLLATRSCRTLPPYQAGHRASDRLAASQQLLCSSKNAPRSKRRTSRGTETVLRCVRLPRHLFVRCPFLVRCSSLRSNNGGSPIRPLSLVIHVVGTYSYDVRMANCGGHRWTQMNAKC